MASWVGVVAMARSRLPPFKFNSSPYELTDTAIAEKSALQKKTARAPIVSHIVAPTAKPPETGKPLWSKPRSS